MTDYQVRVIEEKEQLSIRIVRLASFIRNIENGETSGIRAAEEERLRLQLRLMKEYSAVLVERISAF